MANSSSEITVKSGAVVATPYSLTVSVDASSSLIASSVDTKNRVLTISETKTA